jgi:Tol biopolymer transport system component/DNA-binding winged helix-turn-helix (wHTH) protein
MYRFAAFQLDPQTHELRKSGVRVKIQEQSFVVLLRLLERAGKLVPREELRIALWPADTFVDFDTGLNTVIKRLREVLRDSSEGSLFIETVPKLGYRFIAPVEIVSTEQSSNPPLKSGCLGRWVKWWASAAILLTASVLTFLYLSKADRHNSSSLEIVPLTGTSEMEDSPAFSPDGNQIAFISPSSVLDERSGLYTTMIGGEKPLRLTSNPADCCPVWSPDARSVAFVRHEPTGYEIYAVPALGGKLRRLYSEDSVFKEHIGMSARFSLSPDGRYLAVSALSIADGRPAITLMSLEGSSKLRLTSPPLKSNDCCPAFSPDGRSIAFRRSSGPGLVDDLYVVPAGGGEPRQLTSDRRPIGTQIAWTPDSRDIIFSSARGGLYSLWRVPSVGGTSRRVEAVGIRSNAPAIPPFGNRLAYATEVLKVDLWQVGLKDTRHTAGPARLILPSEGFIGIASFSPDGQKLAYESSQTGYNEIWTASNDGSNPTQLTFLKAEAGTPRWSNDGHSIAFDYRPDQHSEIYEVDVLGGPPRLIPTIPGADNAVPSWSRDGNWIYFSSNRGDEPNQIWKVPNAGGTPFQLTRKGGTWPNEGADRNVYYSKSFRSDEIWKIPRDGGEESLVLKAAGLDSWSWTLAAGGIYFITDENKGRGTLFLYDFETRKILTVLPFEKRVVEPAISSDGSSLVFFQIDQWEKTIMLVNNFR